MKYIYDSASGIIDFKKYSDYIESVKSSFPKHIYDFVSNENHFNLHAASTLHDAWLKSFTVQEIISGKRNKIRKTEISISLLGATHDRLINLYYSGITHYSNTYSALAENRAHGDLLTHEICLVDAGIFSHELLFENGSIYIECADIQHNENLINE